MLTIKPSEIYHRSYLVYVSTQQIFILCLTYPFWASEPRRPQPQKLSTGYFDRHFERLRRNSDVFSKRVFFLVHWLHIIKKGFQGLRLFDILSCPNWGIQPLSMELRGLTNRVVFKQSNVGKSNHQT